MKCSQQSGNNLTGWYPLIFVVVWQWYYLLMNVYHCTSSVRWHMFPLQSIITKLDLIKWNYIIYLALKDIKKKLMKICQNDYAWVCYCLHQAFSIRTISMKCFAAACGLCVHYFSFGPWACGGSESTTSEHRAIVTPWMHSQVLKLR